MSLKPAYKFFFVILHMFYSLLYFVYDHCYYLRRRFGASSHAASISYVNREARKFNKIPTHLTLLLGQEKHSINDLTNIILWSMAAGISFVSIYDCKGKRTAPFCVTSPEALSTQLQTRPIFKIFRTPQKTRKRFSVVCT